MERVTFGGSASMQAVTRVNAEQASKTHLQEPTRLRNGEGRRYLEESEWNERSTQIILPG